MADLVAAGCVDVLNGPVLSLPCVVSQEKHTY